MPKTVKSQWDFGELFPPAQTRRVFTVAELTGQIRRLLEAHLGRVWVAGEITNLRAQASGHVYFTLKDHMAQLACVLFRGEAKSSRDLLAEGRQVLLEGELTVYEPRGQYQLRVMTVELQGVGALQLAFERLKRKLQAEGLFATERKRPLPRYPQRIGVATSPTGAALRDVLHVVQRRQPSLEIILAPCRVQGQGAAEEIAAAIRRLNEWSVAQAAPPRGQAARPAAAGGGLDLLLVTRGGGSLEDLWAFNEEVVARAIFESALPVVSAVGHEIDFTISDFVADLRAATPSAAAEILTEGAVAGRQFLAEASRRLTQSVRHRLGLGGDDLDELVRRLARAHPRRRIEKRWQRLDELQAGLERGVRARWREVRHRWEGLCGRWARLRPGQVVARRAQTLAELGRRLSERTRAQWQLHHHRCATLAERLRLLAPAQVLARGYSITLDAATGKVIRSAGQTRPGQTLTTRLHEGQVRSIVADRDQSSQPKG